MSKLEELIQELCPNGVEYKKLGEIGSFKKGNSITQKNMIQGKIPVIAGGIKPAYFCNQFNRQGETIVISSSGVNAGFVSYWNEPIFVSDAFSIHSNSLILLKFLYYYLLVIQDKIYSCKKGGGIPHVYSKDIANFLIPLPPLEVQKEIVCILDTFTELTENLVKELTLRKKQYEYYREKLFTFDDNVEWVFLEQCIKKNVGGGTPSKSKKSYWNGSIPWISVKDIINTSVILDNYTDTITEEGFKNSSTNIIEKNNIIIATRINPGKICINNFAVAINQDLRGLYLKDNLLNKFLVYYFQTLSVEGRGTTVKGINLTELNKIKIPLPSLDEQERIVKILDKFDALCHDLSIGLPAEIEKRQKQYEYYREKLLTFKEKQ